MNNELPDERPHAKIGPSGLKYFKMCPGYQSSGEASAASERGSRIHFALETGDFTQLEDEEELEIAHECQRQKDALVAEFKELTGDENPIELIEQRFYLDLGCTTTFGTGDFLFISGHRGLLGDFKSGVMAIDPPPQNLQATAYVVGAFQAHPELKEITAAFICPRYSVEPLVGTYYRDQLPAYIREVAQIVLLAEIVGDKWDEGTPAMHELSPGDACSWCCRQDQCPALGAIAIEVANRYAPDLMPSDGVHFEDFDNPAEHGKMLVVAGIMEKWAKGFKYKTVTAVKDGTLELPFHRLKSMGSPREVTDTSALAEVAESIGITKDDLFTEASFSLASLAEIVKARAPRGKKGEMVRQFEEDLELHGALTRQAERFSLVSTRSDDSDV